MRIAITDALYEDNTAWDTLDALMLIFLRKRHVWGIDNPHAVLNSKWVLSDAGGRAGSNPNLCGKGIYR